MVYHPYHFVGEVLLQSVYPGPHFYMIAKITFKLICITLTAENLRVWKWHMTIAFHFFSQYWHFMKFIILPLYQIPTLFSTKEGFKALWMWCFSPSFPCTSGAAPVTQRGTIQIHNRGPKYWTFPCIYDISFLIFLQTPSLHIEMVTYGTSYNNHKTCQIAYVCVCVCVILGLCFRHNIKKGFFLNFRGLVIT